MSEFLNVQMKNVCFWHYVNKSVDIKNRIMARQQAQQWAGYTAFGAAQGAENEFITSKNWKNNVQQEGNTALESSEVVISRIYTVCKTIFGQFTPQTVVGGRCTLFVLFNGNTGKFTLFVCDSRDNYSMFTQHRLNVLLAY